MKTRGWSYVVGLFSIFVLALSAAPVEAISNVSLTVPGTYFDVTTPAVCGDDLVVIDANITGTATTDDSGGSDYFAVLYLDVVGNVMDVDILNESLGPFSTYNSDDIGIGSLSNPMWRPFVARVYDIPYYSPAGGENTPTAAAWIQANGTEVYSTTFDPSFAPACALLPLDVTAIPALNDTGLALLGLLLAAGALGLLRRWHLG